MLTKPLPVGAPLPPLLEDPHAAMAPDESSAAKAPPFEKILTNPLPVGAPLPHGSNLPTLRWLPTGQRRKGAKIREYLDKAAARGCAATP